MSQLGAVQNRIVRYRKGDVLFRENDDTQDFFIIKSGSVRILKKIGNKEITLDTLGPGMVAGEIASIDKVPRTASGVALADTEVILIPQDSVKKILDNIPDWFRKIAQILVQRLREVDDRISRSLKSDYTALVAAMITMISYSEKAATVEDGFQIERKFLEYELMDLLTIPLAEVQSAIDKCAVQGFLRVAGNDIVLTNREACTKLGAEEP
ncbi:MAG: Crp/Fnr family transcriptional regulator [Chitinispirillaceae bacterium]|nr:Crp/Fnr family transcriptional regulator [Chitinispirillaceae bacterium]